MRRLPRWAVLLLAFVVSWCGVLVPVKEAEAAAFVVVNPFLGSMAAAGPAALVVAGLAVLGFAGAYVYDNWDSITMGLGNMWATISEATANWIQSEVEKGTGYVELATMPAEVRAELEAGIGGSGYVGARPTAGSWQGQSVYGRLTQGKTSSDTVTWNVPFELSTCAGYTYCDFELLFRKQDASPLFVGVAASLTVGGLTIQSTAGSSGGLTWRTMGGTPDRITTAALAGVSSIAVQLRAVSGSDGAWVDYDVSAIRWRGWNSVTDFSGWSPVVGVAQGTFTHSLRDGLDYAPRSIPATGVMAIPVTPDQLYGIEFPKDNPVLRGDGGRLWQESMPGWEITVTPIEGGVGWTLTWPHILADSYDVYRWVEGDWVFEGEVTTAPWQWDEPRPLIPPITWRIDAIRTIDGARTISRTTTVTAQPAGPGPGGPTCKEIALGPLMGLVSTRFPFSLPWDIGRLWNALQVEPTPPDLNLKLVAFGHEFSHGIDLSPFNGIMAGIRWLELAGLAWLGINATRKWLGGAV